MTKTYSAETSISIKASVDDVWDALVNPSMIKRYLHDTNMETDWKVGAPIVWKGEWKGKAYEDKGVVLQFEPKRLIRTTHWSPLSGKEDTPENYHEVTYEISADDGQTTLTLRQGNSPTQEDADGMVENGWKPILQTMKELLETKS
jgi:uncharacterized protein YndB with AHSA1/START domain